MPAQWLSRLDWIVIHEDHETGTGRPLYELDKPLGFRADDDSEYWVPEGFRSDGASVPRLPVAWLLAGGSGHRAAVLHDWALTVFERRKLADDLFLEGLTASGVPAWKAWLMWVAVRVNSLLNY